MFLNYSFFKHTFRKKLLLKPDINGRYLFPVLYGGNFRKIKISSSTDILFQITSYDSKTLLGFGRGTINFDSSEEEKIFSAERKKLDPYSEESIERSLENFSGGKQIPKEIFSGKEGKFVRIKNSPSILIEFFPSITSEEVEIKIYMEELYGLTGSGGWVVVI